MAIQHKDIPEGQIHEPKGISLAANRQVYVADGSGSGDWAKIKSENLEGLAGDGGVAGMLPTTDGSNGFSLVAHASYGVMGVTNNTVSFPLTAASDTTLQTNSDYVLFTGIGAPWMGDSLYGVTFDTNKLTVTKSGVYDVRFWANIYAFPSNVAYVGAKFKINGTNWSPRTIVSKSNSSGDHGELNAFGLVSLTAGDYVQLFVASSASGNLVIRNANLTVDLRRGT